MLMRIWNQRMIFRSVDAFMIADFLHSKLETQHKFSPGKNRKFTESKAMLTVKTANAVQKNTRDMKVAEKNITFGNSMQQRS